MSKKTEMPAYPGMYLTYRLIDGVLTSVVFIEQFSKAQDNMPLIVVDVTKGIDASHTPVEKQYYQADILLHEDNTATAVSSLNKVKEITKAMLEASRQRIADTNVKIEKVKAEIKAEAEKAFLITNAVPEIPKELFIDEKTWGIAVTCLKQDKYALLLGPKGCGKTETAKRLAEALDWDFAAFNMGAAFKPKQMFAGMLHAEDGTTKFIESEFLKAFRGNGDEGKPTLIFLDELTRLPQAASNYLMTILDRNQSYIYIEELGKRIYRGKNVRIVSAGNIGSQYTDTRTLDGAFWDRFIKLTVDYLPAEKELELVMQRAPKADKKLVKALIQKAQKCRTAEKEGTLSTGISTRQIIDMANLIECGFTWEDIMDKVLINNFINGNNNEIEEASAILQS